MNKSTRFALALGTLVFASVLSLLVVGYLGPDASDGGQVRSSGEARIGGDFELTSHTGATVKDADFRGKYMLIFFGFTFCPDVCPTELQIITAALEELGPDAEKIQPIFVTIDPERDTPEAMATYVGHFHPSMMGLTGTPEQIDTIAKAYRVYYKKVDDPSSAAEYPMDHSAIVYLMDPEGKFVKHFAGAVQPADMAETLKTLIN